MTAAFAEPFTGTDHDDFREWARELRDYRIERAYDRPVIELYDGDWVFRGRVYGELAGNFDLIVNETGIIQLRLPIDLDDRRGTWAAFWALDEEARGTSNIHVIIETMGARIAGRMKPQNGVTLTRSDQGDEVTIDFLEDTEEFKYIHTAGNPFLPISLIQQPKAWMLPLQADHGLLLTLAANLPRLQLANINVDGILNLLNPDNWTIEGMLDGLTHLWHESQIVVIPRHFGDSVAPLALIVGSINTSWFDVAAPILEDAELQIVTRRWKNGDPEPWPGAGTNWRQGQLFVGIEDKSAFRRGTSIGGNLLTGFTRTIADVMSNHVEDSYDLFTGDTIDETGYRLPGLLFTAPEHPYVVYRDADITGILTSTFSRGPGGPCRITVGGQSMPGVNELISALVQYGGDVLGDNLSAAISAGIGYTVSVGSLGGALDSFLNPIYKDSILAHMSVPLLLRAQRQGWGHYLETTSTNVTQAFTAASVMDLRARRRETDPDTAFTLQVANALPWLIGDNGFGHWWLGDRVGGTSKYLMPRVFVRRNRKLSGSWGEGKGMELVAEFGATRNSKDALERMTELVAKAMSGLQQIGLWSVLILTLLVGVTS
ncbi:Gp37-like protein, partial [Tsukamurella ocularis]